MNLYGKAKMQVKNHQGISENVEISEVLLQGDLTLFYFHYL